MAALGTIRPPTPGMPPVCEKKNRQEAGKGWSLVWVESRLLMQLPPGCVCRPAPTLVAVGGHKQRMEA